MPQEKSRALTAAVARAIHQWGPSAIAVSATALPLYAFAADECGIPIPGEPVVCDASNNPYEDGIAFDNVADDLELILQSGANIERAPGGNNHGIRIESPGGAITVRAEENSTISVSGADAHGIRVHGARDIVIESSAAIYGGRGGLRGWIFDPTSSDDILISVGEPGFIRITEASGTGIDATNDGGGAATAVLAGRIESTEWGTYAVHAFVGAAGNGGDATTEITETGSVLLNSGWGAGTYSLAYGAGAARSIVAGTITALGVDDVGLLSVYASPAGSGSTFAELTETGVVSTAGSAGFGVWAITYGLGPVDARSFGRITTLGDDAVGLRVDITNAASAADALALAGGTGTIDTSGDFAHAISMYNSGAGASSVFVDGDAAITTRGAAAHGVYGRTGGLLSLVQSASSSLTASGLESFGSHLKTASDVTQRLSGAVTASGEFGIGAASFADGSAEQTIEATATIRGGWQFDTTGLGPSFGYASSGVLLDAGTSAHLINHGTITAGSDRAVIARGDDVTIDNSGSLTGFIELSGNNSAVFNNAAAATFELRHFADTDGDDVRDTKRVAIADFGSPASVFNNASDAILKLALIENELTSDATGYYIPTTGLDLRPLDNSVYQLNRAGIVQGQLVNLATFNHSGVIDLRGPAIGNTLVITGAPTATGAPGNGLFVSNGGSLLLNVLLNEGIAPGGNSGSQADVLIVDGTQLGSGATRIVVDRKEGDGAQTPGNGILLVEVRNKALSAPDVFTLQGDYVQNGMPSIVLGAYAYSLFHNGAGDDNTDGNWYLRSSLSDLNPPDPDPDPDPEPEPDPNPNPDPEPDPDPNPNPNPEPDPDPNPNPDPGPDPDPNPNPDPEPDPDPNPNPDPGPDPDPNPNPDPEPDPDPNPNPDPGPDPDPNPNPDPETDPDSNPDPDTDPDPNSEPDPNENPEPEPEQDPESESEQDPEEEADPDDKDEAEESDSSPPPEVAPRFQPGVPVYESYTVNLQALNTLPSLQQRVGNRVWAGDADADSSGAWGRTYGANSTDRAATSSAAVEQSIETRKLQLGVDRLLFNTDDGDRLIASLAIEYGEADSTVRSIFGDGRLSTKGYGLGTMWTWYGHKGTYLDAQAQINRYKSDLQSSLLGQLVKDHDGSGKAFSLEAGKKIALDEIWSITPQTQLVYSSVKFDRFTDPAGAVVSTNDAASLTSRAGLAITREHATQHRVSHAYLIANFIYEWENGLHTQVSGVNIERMDRRQWGELGIGASINWSNGVRLYGEFSGKSTLHDISESYVVHGTVGIGVRF
jgi:outer membrane autotransporter protein